MKLLVRIDPVNLSAFERSNEIRRLQSEGDVRGLRASTSRFSLALYETNGRDVSAARIIRATILEEVAVEFVKAEYT